jgi:hypothetical protein
MNETSAYLRGCGIYFITDIQDVLTVFHLLVFHDVMSSKSVTIYNLGAHL